MSKVNIKLLIAAAAATSLLLTVPALTLPAFADSQARVVRLSEVQGDVQVDRNAGQGLEKAFLNLPISQGVKLQTGKDGRAEVEFEDGSTLRVTPETVITFPQLSLRDSGAKVSTVHLQEGSAYVNFAGSKDDEFTLTFAHEKLALAHSAHLRLEMGDADATLAVFNGEVQIQGDAGTVAVSKNHTAQFDLTDDDHYELAKSVEPDPFDQWDKEQNQYHQQYASNSYSSYSPYAYGTNDLNYYGSFSNVPGYGNVWQPYFAGAGWDPFMNGAWAFTPGFGYGWVSGYPWGWTPYHYGSWVYLPTSGWGWLPGGTWTGWSTPRIVHPPANFLPPQPPSNPGHGTVVVNRGPAPVQLGRSFNRMEIAKNSAGLGIPRGGIKNLNQLSGTVQQQGFATARVHTAPVGVSWWNGGGFYGPGPAAAGHAGGFSSASAGHASAGAGHSGGGAGAHR
jgi:FecR protein